MNKHPGRLRTAVIALLALTLGSLAAAADPQAQGTADAHKLSVADYLQFEQVSDPQLSPDGKQIVYTRRWVDQKADRWASALWIMDADGSRQRFLHDGSNARWSPSGDRILFIDKGDNDKPQIFVRWMDDGGAVSQVTRIDVSPSSPAWSPDGTQIAFVAIVPTRDNWKIDMPPAPKGADWSKPPRILDRLHYRQDRVGYTDPGFTHLFVVPAASGTARQLTHGDWNVGAQFDGLFGGAGLDWTPDGKKIVFDGWKENDGDLEYQRSNIYSIDVASETVTQLTKTVGFWSAPVVSSDGRQIAYMGYPDSKGTYSMPRIRVMDIDGGDARQLSDEFDHPPSRLIWDNRDRGLYFTAQDDGYVNVFHIALDGDVQAVTSGKQAVSLSSADRAVDLGVGVLASADEPGDVNVFKLKGRSTPKRLTAVNDDLLATKTLGKQQEIWYTASDGNKAHGWIVTPPDFDPAKKYPLIMEIHGGPFGMYRGVFNFNYQVFAANGYAVLYTNPRGSTGYGEAYSKAIDFDYPGVDYLDLMGGVDATVAKGFVDTDRMYVGGCSGGGVLSSWVIGHTDRFAAAAVRCPVTDWLSMAGMTDVPGFTFSFFEQPFWKDPSEWLKHSSLMYVGNVTTPTMIMTGVQDMRTPMPQSEEFYSALKMRGVPARLVRMNDQYHGTGTKPSNNMRTMLYMMSWYGMWTEQGKVGGDAASPSPSGSDGDGDPD